LRGVVSICLIIPAYNEAKAIGNVICRAKKFIEVCDIIVIDDGSEDETSTVAQLEGARVIRHPKNLGKGMALRTGFKCALDAEYGLIVTMDADGQHDPEDIPKFLEKLEAENPDVIVGARTIERSQMPLHRRANNKLVTSVGCWLAGQRVDDFQCGFRLIRTQVLKSISLETCRYETESEFLIKSSRMGFKIASLPIKTIYNGETSDVKTLREIFLFTRLLLKSIFCSHLLKFGIKIVCKSFYRSVKILINLYSALF
jgi:glycosyltransferase involved in cell wall biosynthesis